MKTCVKCGKTYPGHKTFCESCAIELPKAAAPSPPLLARKTNTLELAGLNRPAATRAEFPLDEPLPPRSTPVPHRPRPVIHPDQPAARPVTRKEDVPIEVRERKIVGILVTFSWKLGGQIYPLREGRNMIGRDPKCDIIIAEDPTMEGWNSFIQFQHRFVAGDNISSLGTWVNGEPIESENVPLDNYAAIRAASTEFTFILVEPRTAAPDPA